MATTKTTLTAPIHAKKAIKVTFENNVLTIEGQRELTPDVERERFHRIERGYGEFRRSFSLPATVDAARVDASYQDGVLKVTLPQRAEAKPKQIQIA